MVVYIARDLEETLEATARNGGPSPYASAPLALIIHINATKTARERIEIPLETMFRYFCDLCVEVNLEIVNRQMGTQVESATLETIFTDRDEVRILSRNGL